MDLPTETNSQETVALPEGRAVSRPHLTHSAIPDEGRFIAGTLLAGRYRVVGLLGKGGMGEVYRATDLALGQSVALKFLPAAAAENPMLLERFHGEVRVARQVSHPNVCRVFDIGEADGVPFISMEYVDGEDLSSLLLRIGRLPADKAVDTARRICAGLAAAHAKGVIHRDLKPHNVMMNRRGEIVIMDFGLAAIADQLSGPEARNGTPAYMSPEQLKGTEVTSRSDIYALGLVLYELFTGKRPYEAKSARQMIALQEQGQFPSVNSAASDVDPAVDQVVRRCLDPDPLKRPESALAVSAALPGGDPLAAALAAGETPSPELVAASGRTAAMPAKQALLWITAVLVCIGIAPWLKQQKVAFYRQPEGYPTEVLRQKGREIAASLGYLEKPGDTAIQLYNRLGLLSWLNGKPAPRDWNSWLASEPITMASYRESPEALVAGPMVYVDSQNPPLTVQGMATVYLDITGRLRGFDALPRSGTKETPRRQEDLGIDAVFSAAQLDRSKFTEVPANAVPTTPTDVLRAWKGPHPKLPGTEITLEIGEWKGQVTHVEFVWPWISAANQSRNPLMAQIRTGLDAAMAALGIFFAIILARRNWKQGRGDRRGALAVGVTALILKLSVWAGLVHAVPSASTMSRLFFEGLTQAVFMGAMLMLYYLAMEPWVRARWPHSMITWSRVLAGNWRDAQVNAHILTGVALGLALWVGDEIRLVLAIPRQGLDTGSGLYSLLGSRQWLGLVASRGEESFRLGLVIFFSIFGLRMLLRKDWIAAIATAAVFSLLEGNLENTGDLPAEFAGYMVLFTILMFVLLRMGMLVTIVSVFSANSIGGATLGTDWSAWYASPGLASVALILGIALWSLNNALGPDGILGPAKQPIR